MEIGEVYIEAGYNTDHSFVVLNFLIQVKETKNM